MDGGSEPPALRILRFFSLFVAVGEKVSFAEQRRNLRVKSIFTQNYGGIVGAIRELTDAKGKGDFCEGKKVELGLNFWEIGDILIGVTRGSAFELWRYEK